MIAPLLATTTQLAEMTWHRGLIVVLADVGFVVVIVGIALCTVRVLRGPHLADRAAAVDTIAVQLVGLVVLLTLRQGSLALFDGVLVLSMIGFAGSVGMAQYMIRRAVARQARQAERAAQKQGGGDGE
jgi:multisubunit Na+/H+ antiporter MnhF subunit